MFANLESKPSRRSGAGWTLMEMMMAVAVSVIVLSSMTVIMVYITRSFIAVSNYGILNQSSRYALDVMNRDIRNASAVLSGTTNKIIMSNPAGDTFSYAWDKTKETVTRSYTNLGGSVQVRVLLTNCDAFSFYYYHRVPTNPPSGIYGPYFISATNSVTDAKLINVDWRCYRPIMGAKQNTESVQTAQIVIRN